MPTLQAPVHVALFDLQLLGGRRWYQIDASSKKQATTGAEAVFAWHVTPFPNFAVPVALGMRSSYASLNPQPIVHDASTYQIITLAAEAIVKAPRLYATVPYLRISEPFYGTYDLRGHADDAGRSGIDRSAKVQGPTAAIGATLQVGPYLGLPAELELQIEYSHGFETYQVSSLSIDGVTQPKDPRFYGLSSNAVLLGLSWSGELLTRL